MNPSRTERVKFDFSITDKPELIEGVKEVFGMGCFDVFPGDTLKTSYTFTVEYMGDIERKFRKLIELMDNGVMIDANMEEMRHGTCLFEQLVTTYHNLKDKIQANKVST